MIKESVDTIVECMAISNGDSSIQKVQTEHRLKLAKFWDIKEGDHVLEIGCGQGDTTAVLAYLVGEKGFVQGIDIASPDYGSPVSLGRAAEKLSKSKLGNQIKINFEVDVLSPTINFPDKSFDIIVLSHCSWYFKTFEQLYDVLKKVKKWGKKLCFAEWDARINSSEQLPHFLAVLIQAQYECFKENSLSNVRTLFTANDLKDLAERAGWSIIKEQSILSNTLQDGEWEVANTLNNFQLDLEKIDNMPLKLKSLIQSEVTILKEVIKTTEIKPMSTYAFIAE
jgi:ubiquinone/menaquinone biosynthesis C-methylase UbiE